MDTDMRHDITVTDDPAAGRRVARCVVCAQEWDTNRLTAMELTGLPYLSCPGAPPPMVIVPEVSADLYDFSDFKPERGEVPADYQTPAQKRKARIRELFAELGELLAEDGT